MQSEPSGQKETSKPFGKKIQDRIKSTSAPGSSARITWIITNIFVGAASIYLHAIVSGTSSEVPKIKLGVADTIEAIKLVPDDGLIKRLTWPVCVTACLAGPDHMSFFEQLDRGLAEQYGGSQSILRGLKVAKEC